jgi:putative FmdB family regulatory protein
MPIYEYACRNCEHTLDALQKISDEPLLECPECGKPQLKRLISAPRFRLKGEGWYETDFKKDKQRNLSKGEGDGAASSKSESADSASGAKTDGDRSDSRTTAKAADSKSDASNTPKKPADSKPTSGKSTDSKSE